MKVKLLLTLTSGFNDKYFFLFLWCEWLSVYPCQDVLAKPHIYDEGQGLPKFEALHYNFRPVAIRTDIKIVQKRTSLFKSIIRKVFNWLQESSPNGVTPRTGHRSRTNRFSADLESETRFEDLPLSSPASLQLQPPQPPQSPQPPLPQQPQQQQRSKQSRSASNTKSEEGNISKTEETR